MDVKQVRLKILGLMDKHGDSLSTCKGCPICKELNSLSKLLNRKSSEKFQHILAKGQDMTKSDIAFLLENEVGINEIRRAIGISNTTFSEIIVQWGLSQRKNFKTEREMEMAKIQMTVDEFIDLKYKQGLSLMKIAELKGVKDASIHYWKNQRQEQIELALKELCLADVRKEKTTKTKVTKEDKTDEFEAQIAKLKEQLSGRNDEIVQMIAACDDLENEAVALRDENQSLKKQIEELENAPLPVINVPTPEPEIGVLKLEISQLRAERAHLRQLLKFYL